MKNAITIILGVLLAISIVVNIMLLLDYKSSKTESNLQSHQTTSEGITPLTTRTTNSVVEKCRDSTGICIFKDYNISTHGTVVGTFAQYQLYYEYGENRSHFIYRKIDDNGWPIFEKRADFSMDVYNEFIDLICSNGNSLDIYTYAVDQNGKVVDHIVPWAIILGNGYYMDESIILQGPQNLDEILTRFEKLVVDAGWFEPVIEAESRKVTDEIGLYYPIKDLYNNMSFALRSEEGSPHWVSISEVRLYLDETHADYERFGSESALASESKILQDLFRKIFSTYRIDELNADTSKLNEVLLTALRNHYNGSEFIKDVSIVGITIK